MSQFKDQIEVGAALLDEKIPEWEGRQELRWLDLMSGCDCVLGQAEDERDYWTTVRKLFPHAQSEDEIFNLSVAHGFNIEIQDRHELSEDDEQNYRKLTREWKQFITDRRSQKHG